MTTITAAQMLLVKLCKHAHKEPNKAIIKVVHKLLNRIRAVIISGIPYQTGLVK